MTRSDRHARIKQLFVTTCERSAAQRAELLEAECEGDPALRREVEVLLSHYDEDPLGPAPSPAEPSTSERFSAGQIIAGRYRIVSRLGHGGMGEIYRAEDQTLGIPVALKFLRTESPRSREQLLNEVRLAREISHPAVCRVFDVGDAAGQTFFTMEYIEGEDLASLLRRIGRLPASKVLELARELCAALAAAHQRGVLHRDLKPANIMLDANGRVRILDFGIAVREGEEDRRSFGTPAYMAPEQLEPNAALTEQTDLYALGLVLYELVAGRPVFLAMTIEERKERERSTLELPANRAADLDPRLQEVVLQALREDPRERPATAESMAQMLGEAPTDHDTAESAPTLLRESGERRHLTVMFCDLINSDTLLQRLGPEVYVDVLKRYHSCCAEAVTRYDGHVAQYVGDGVLVYFGHPQAHEDDAGRAVRAGRDILQKLQEVSAHLEVEHGMQLTTRIGIHSGPVVVGEVGAGERKEMRALGDTPTIAAALEAFAQPGTLVISDSTLRLVAGMFVTEDLGTPALEGVEDPIRAYRILQPSGIRSRLDRATRLSTFVGRTQELGLLADRFERAQRGHGQAVLIAGEAGIGKSRLVHELRSRLSEAPHSWLECRTSPYTKSSALHPLVELLEGALRLDEEGAAEEKLARLEQGLAQSGLEPERATPLIAGLLSLPLPERYAPLGISPQLQRQKTIETLLAWVLRLAERQPLVLVMEDLHWIDPSTLEWLGQLIEQCPTANLLVVMTYRPDFDPPWPGREHVLPIQLNPLREAETRELIAGSTGETELPEELVEQIATRCDGVPLFAEELAREIVEAGAPESRQIPETLQDSLMSRLDRLGDAKEVAQLGAVLGREFAYELIESVAPMTEAVLRRGLARMVEAELLYQRGLAPAAIYTFKHALVQDSAHLSLLFAQRRKLHGGVADALEAKFAERVAREPAEIARHCEEAGRTSEAINHYGRAAERASERFAQAEAVGHLHKAIELLGGLPDDPERDELELQLQIELQSALFAAKGGWHPDVERVHERTQELSTHVGQSPELFRALVGLSLFRFSRGEVRASCELAERALHLANRQGEVYPRLVAHTRLGYALAFHGELAAGLEHLEQAIALHAPVAHRPLAAVWGQDWGVAARSLAAGAMLRAGHADRARALMEETVELAREGDPYSLGYALACDAALRCQLREHDPAREMASEALEIGRKRGFPLVSMIAAGVRGWAVGGSRGVEEIRTAIEQSPARFPHLGEHYHWLAETYRENGQLQEALTAVEDGFDHLNEARFPEISLYRAKGEILLQLEPQSHREEAEHCLRRALEIAQRRGGRHEELRTATNLARMLLDRGDRQAARAQLEPIVGWFTEGLDTRSLKDAKALLA